MRKTMLFFTLFFMIYLAKEAQATTWPGPDTRGYTGSTISYSFTDISGTGTALNLSDDQLSAAVPIGFSFNFYGTVYTNAYVSSNGFITFDPASDPGCCEGQNLPDPMGPNSLIAGYWTDLNPAAGGTIRYLTTGSAGSRRFIVQYLNVPMAGGGTTASFQILLHEGSNNIELQFLSALTNGSQGYVTGIENSDGTAALRYNYGSYSLSAVGILIAFPVITLGTQPVDQTVCSGSNAAFTASASSPAAPAVQWQVSTDGGSTFSNIPGATAPTLNIAGDPAQSGNLYHAVFSNWAGTATTSAGMLTVGSLSVTSPVIPSGVTNSPYPDIQFNGSGGIGTVTFAITGGALPSGMNLSSTGLLSGTPTQAGNFNFTVTASDANSCSGSSSYSLAVDTAAAVAVPAMNEWGMIFFVLVAGLAAALQITRRRA